ncbi:hypothetical protein BC941DRAFT_430618 [Chlamydoabsidia padenii]|nr:hypothetical protein BC941DRAFT_430618 [Chlamydoabsidia padenii]
MPILNLLTTDQYAPLIDQLAQHHQPSATHLLGWFLQTGHSSVDTLGRSKVYSTHPDPSYLPTNEPVVIVVNHFHRLRIYLSTESTLDRKGHVSATMKQQAIDGDWSGEKAPQFYGDNDALQSLYRRSVEKLETVLLELTSQGDNNSIMFHGLSLLWQPLVNMMFEVSYYGPCHMFVKPAEIIHGPLDSPYPISKLNPMDLKMVVEKNKILYDSSYVEDCFRMSTALRNNQGELIAWGYTHRDLPIGGLHVLAEYRRRNLASIIVGDLCNQQTQFLIDHAPYATTLPYYVQSLVEYTNPGSTALFERLGFTKVGLGKTWTFIIPKTLT